MLATLRVSMFNRLSATISRIISSYTKLKFGEIHLSAARNYQKPKRLKGKNVTSQNWIRRQLNDPYISKAKESNYRCRSAFKLIEIDDKYRILKPGYVVVDCGASPGSWTQVAVERVRPCQADLVVTRSTLTPGTACDAVTGDRKTKTDGENIHRDYGDSDAGGRFKNNDQASPGYVLAIDLQHMLPIDGATVLANSDFCKSSTQHRILSLLNGRPVDVVLSDMAPRPSGIKSMDHEVIVDLCLTSLKFACSVLSNDTGYFLCKLWQGGRLSELRTLMEKCFESVKLIKPPATRSESAEIYLLGIGFKLRKHRTKEKQ